MGGRGPAPAENSRATSTQIDRSIGAIYSSLVGDVGFSELVDAMARLGDAVLQREHSPDVIERLTYHVGIAREMRSRLPLPTRTKNLEAEVSQRSGAAFAVSGKGKVIIASHKAESVFGLTSGDKLGSDWADISLARAVKRQLKSIRRGDPVKSRVFSSTSVATGASILVETYTVASPGTDERVLVVASLDRSWHDSVGNALSEAFGLTDSEVDVAKNFFLHASIDRVSQSRGTTVATVRKQLKSIYEKMGLGGQVELLAKLAQVRGSRMAESSQPVFPDPLGREEVLTLPNGRKVAWTWMGAENGRPVLLAHGLWTGYLLPTQAIEQLRRKNIRIIVVQRPGFGRSSAMTELSPVEASARAYAAVLDHLNIQSVVGASMSSGLSHLTHFGRTHPGRLDALAMLSGMAPLEPAAATRNLPDSFDVVMRLFSSAPEIFDFMVEACIRDMWVGGPSRLAVEALADSVDDARLLSSMENASRLDSIVEHVLQNGIDNVRNAVTTAFYDFDADIEALGVPTFMIHGKTDPFSPPEWVQAFSERHHNVTTRLIENAGHLTFLSAPHEAVRCIEDALREA